MTWADLHPNQLMLHVIVPVRYSGDTPRFSRQLYQFMCDLASSDCTGTMLHLDQADAGKPITALDLGVLTGAKLLSVAGTVAVIKWGPLRTFEIDFAQGRARYVESGEGMITGTVEGRGEAKCTPAVVR